MTPQNQEDNSLASLQAGIDSALVEAQTDPRRRAHMEKMLNDVERVQACPRNPGDMAELHALADAATRFANKGRPLIEFADRLAAFARLDQVTTEIERANEVAVARRDEIAASIQEMEEVRAASIAATVEVETQLALANTRLWDAQTDAAAWEKRKAKCEVELTAAEHELAALREKITTAHAAIQSVQ